MVSTFKRRMGERARAARNGRGVTRAPASFGRWAWMCASPGAFVIVSDTIRRGAIFARFDRLHAFGYAASALASVITWALFMISISAGGRAAKMLGALLFVPLFALSQGVEGAFQRTFGVYLSVDSLIDARAFAPALLGELPLERPIVALHFALGCVAAIGFAWKAMTTPPPRRLTITVVALAPLTSLILLFSMPVSYRKYQSTTPDFIYMNGERVLFGEKLRTAQGGGPRLIRVARRHPDALGAIHASPPVPRNVLFVLEESQRADETCTAPVAACDRATPASNLAAPNRLPLLEMRAVGSSTAVAIGTLWSGLVPTAKGSHFETAPLLWDYAHAAGYDTAYWTSQDLMFGNARLFVEDLPVSHEVSGTGLDPMADILVGATDASLTTRVLAEIGDLKEPYFAVVHYSNIHKPRLVDPDAAPFQPSDMQYEEPGDQPGQVALYKNAVYPSDRAVARLIEGVRRSRAGDRTVIFFMSDHGESYLEHGQGNNHSGSVYDEEIRVPAWVDAPSGVLTEGERTSLERARSEPTYETDVAATLLDLMGIHDAIPGRYADEMIGRSLVGGDLHEVTVPLTNVCWAWEYLYPNWGVMRGHRKVEARSHDPGYHCFDLDEDPFERVDLGEAACADLVSAANDTFHMLPKELGRLATNPAWGSGP